MPCYHPANLTSMRASVDELLRLPLRAVAVANSVEVAQALEGGLGGAAAEVRTPSRNLGFGGAVNAVAFEPRPEPLGEWLWIINDDVALTGDDVSAMARAVGAVSPDVAVVAGVNEGHRLSPLPGAIRGAVRLAGLARLERWWDRQARRAEPGTHEVDPGVQVPFWFVAVRRRAFDAVGGFDEGAPLYFEDVLLQHQLRQAGWGAAYVTVRARHQGSASGKRAARVATVAAAAGYVRTLVVVRGLHQRTARLLAAVAAVSGLPAAALRRAPLRKELTAGLVGALRWSIRPHPIELPHHAAGGD